MADGALKVKAGEDAALDVHPKTCLSLLNIFTKKLNLKSEDDSLKVLESVDLAGIVKYMKSDACKNIIVMVGAGISTSAGIPDFRSPDSGIYANLEKYDLPTPEHMFDIGFFKKNPVPFFQLAKELYPGKFKPTLSHYFIKLLHEKKLLLRLYTQVLYIQPLVLVVEQPVCGAQNIDTLERVANIPQDKLVEAHGTFFTSHCINRRCRKEYSLEWMKDKIFSDEIPECLECKTTVKPGLATVVWCVGQDFPMCDLLIVIGTSLQVQPFASLVDNVPTTTPRLLINKEKCTPGSRFLSMMGYSSGFQVDQEDNYRDVLWQGLCDDGCQAIATAMGWKRARTGTKLHYTHGAVDGLGNHERQPDYACAWGVFRHLIWHA
ncbi:SIRT2 [Cordylochernes scorpioides]|uniref:SIRT2 n=1 Tax=Cordylochernes scorpioides TaxID=51811 RepID=A0ABY6LNG5_9ARAC|nr:SIRT2 [Cordylochernes scorpioides]